MRGSWVLALCMSCGNPSYSAVFRPVDEVGFLKLKGEVGQELFDGLLGDEVEEVCSSTGCKRSGQLVLCSTMNVADPVSCEVRVSPGGALLAPDPDLGLYHSTANNRHYGASTREGDRIEIDAAALEGLSSFIDQEPGEVWVEVVDAAQGVLVLHTP